MKTVLIGPKRDFPSWQWYGESLVEGLRKYYNVKVFTGSDSQEKADYTIIVKVPQSPAFVAKQKKTIYCPIDHFDDVRDIVNVRGFLSKLDYILLHCNRLRPFFLPYCPNIGLTEHHTKFMLTQMPPFREKGFVLWVGGFQYLPHILKWASEHKLPHPLKILTDYNSSAAQGRARSIAESIGYTLDTSALDMYEWSPSTQEQLMREAKAAIDIKGSDFSQKMKPPTKVQKYVCSGIPVAVNAESYSFEYMRQLGFPITVPEDFDTWFSQAYWETTQMFGMSLRSHLSLESVAEEIHNLLQGLK